MKNVLAIFLLVIGVVLVSNVAWPILEYEFVKRPKLRSAQLLSPISPKEESDVLGEKSSLPGNLTRASNWFEGYLPEERETSSVRYYTLSIPSLKIDKARVEIGGEDLSKNLIHYKGTSVPGKAGNAVIFGHSVLPQFFNPKNYLTIFSTLPTIKNGAKITLDYDGVTYRYEVSELFEVPPTAVEVLRQYHDGPHLTLVTCVPPGTYLRRLVVRADLLPPEI